MYVYNRDVFVSGVMHACRITHDVPHYAICHVGRICQKPTPRLLEEKKHDRNANCSFVGSSSLVRQKDSCDACHFRTNVQVHIYSDSNVIRRKVAIYRRRGRRMWHLATLPELVFLLWCFFRCASALHLICLLTTSLLALLDISPGCTAAAQSRLYQPCEDGKSTSHPHKGKQRLSNLCPDVKFCHASNSVAEDDKHDGGNDRGDGDEEGVEEGENGDGKG